MRPLTRVTALTVALVLLFPLATADLPAYRLTLQGATLLVPGDSVDYRGKLEATVGAAWAPVPREEVRLLVDDVTRDHVLTTYFGDYFARADFPDAGVYDVRAVATTPTGATVTSPVQRTYVSVPPAAVKAPVFAPGDAPHEVHVTWARPVPDGHSREITYTVHRAPAGTDAWTRVGVTTATSFTDAVHPGRSYAYRVDARNHAGEAPPGETAETTVPDLPPGYEIEVEVQAFYVCQTEIRGTRECGHVFPGKSATRYGSDPAFLIVFNGVVRHNGTAVGGAPLTVTGVKEFPYQSRVVEGAAFDDGLFGGRVGWFDLGTGECAWKDVVVHADHGTVTGNASARFRWCGNGG